MTHRQRKWIGALVQSAAWGIVLAGANLAANAQSAGSQGVPTTAASPSQGVTTPDAGSTAAAGSTPVSAPSAPAAATNAAPTTPSPATNAPSTTPPVQTSGPASGVPASASSPTTATSSSTVGNSTSGPATVTKGASGSSSNFGGGNATLGGTIPSSNSPALPTQPVATAAPPTGTLPASEPLPEQGGTATVDQSGEDQTELAVPDNAVSVENADTMHIDDNDVATLLGNIHIRFRNYRMDADKAVVDTKAGTAILTGHIKMETVDEQTVVHTDDKTTSLTINLRTGEYKLVGSEYGIIPPEQLAATGIIQPVYIKGGDITGEPHLIDARLAFITTCDFPDPHYQLFAEKVDVHPGKRIVLRHVTIYRHGHRLMTVPLIVLPLNDRYQQPNYIPEFGEDPQEGYYAKFGIPYALTDSLTGRAHLDFYSAKGTGYGFDQNFDIHPDPNHLYDASGKFTYYILPDRFTGVTSTNATLTDNEKVFGGFQMHVDSQYAGNPYQLSTVQSSTSTTDFSLIRQTSKVSTNFSANVQQSDFGFGNSVNQTASLQQHWAVPHNGTADIHLSYSGFINSGFDGLDSSSTKTLNTNLAYAVTTGGYLFGATVNKYNTLETTTPGESAFGGVEKLPEVAVTTDRGNPKLLSPILKLFPFLTSAGAVYGQYNDASANAKTARTQFLANIAPQNKVFRALTTTYSGSFEQDFYGDDTARYIYAFRYQELYKFTPLSSFTANYQSLRPFGYTPFFFDEQGKYDNAQTTLAYEPTTKVQLNLVTGFDFTQDQSLYGLPGMPWENVATQLILRPNSVVSTRLQSTFDLNDGQLFALSDDFRVATPSGIGLLTGTQYSPQNHIISSFTESLDLPYFTNKKEGVGYRLNAIAGYNGYTKEFTYKGLQLTRDWHDFELTGVMQTNLGTIATGTTFYINFRLKAFPGIQPFAVGQLGQGLDTSVGDVF